MHILIYCHITSPKDGKNKMVVAAVINEFSNLTKPNALNRLNDNNTLEYSTDLSIESIELGDFDHLLRTITPVDLEKCINKMKSNLKIGKGEKSRRGSKVNHIISKATTKSAGQKGNE